jgi:hypothetical protein
MERDLFCKECTLFQGQHRTQRGAEVACHYKQSNSVITISVYATPRLYRKIFCGIPINALLLTITLCSSFITTQIIQSFHHVITEFDCV